MAREKDVRQSLALVKTREGKAGGPICRFFFAGVFCTLLHEPCELAKPEKYCQNKSMEAMGGACMAQAQAIVVATSEWASNHSTRCSHLDFMGWDGMIAMGAAI